jgi:hypothetical protein
MAGMLDPRSDPVADVGFQPADRPWPKLNRRGKVAVLDVLVQRAARQARALLDLVAAEDGGCARTLGVHVRGFLEVAESGPADMNVLALSWP